MGYKIYIILCILWATLSIQSPHPDALGLQMTTLADVSDMLKDVRREASLSQDGTGEARRCCTHYRRTHENAREK